MPHSILRQNCFFYSMLKFIINKRETISSDYFVCLSFLLSVIIVSLLRAYRSSEHFYHSDTRRNAQKKTNIFSTFLLFRKYIAYARRFVFPKLTKDACRVLQVEHIWNIMVTSLLDVIIIKITLLSQSFFRTIWQIVRSSLSSCFLLYF